MIKAYFEGTCNPNNDGGLMVYETIIYREGTKIHECCEVYERKDNVASNNIAQYCGLIAIFKYLINAEIKDDIHIICDYQLVVGQMSKGWSIKKGKYKAYAEHALKLMDKLKEKGIIITFEWQPVKKNLLSIHRLLGHIYHDGLSNPT